MKAFFIAKVILKWGSIIVLSLVTLLFLFIEGFDRYLATESGAKWLFNDIPNQHIVVKHTTSGLRYVCIGDTSKTPLMLIHGAPGSLYDWKSFAKYERIYSQFHLLIVERPGYGGTRPRKAEPSIKIQAERIAEVLEQERTTDAVVMGHSYGGPIAILLGGIQPHRIAHIYGLSGQYDPDDEITFRISHLINYKIFKYLLPRFIWASNVEKLTHPDGLREILPEYEQVKVPITLVHGNKDSLVPYNNSMFLMDKMKGASASMITLEGHDHPIHMQIPAYLVDLALGKTPEVPPVK